MTQCFSTNTDQYHSFHTFQNYLSGSCIIINFIEKHKLLCQYQFGFRRNHSTFMALVIFLENITTALYNTKFAVCILIDFRKAFDTVEHSILLDKSYHYGIRGNALQWLNSYLTNGYQYVKYKYNNAPSDMKKYHLWYSTRVHIRHIDIFVIH